MRLSTSPFKKSDVVGIKRRPTELHQLPISEEELGQRIEALTQHGPVRTVRNEHGEVITIVGMRIIEDDTAEVWQVPADGMAEKCSVNFVRTLRALERVMAQKYGVTYLFSWCPVDVEHERWMLFMGYELAEKVPGAGWPSGQDAALYTKRVSYGS